MCGGAVSRSVLPVHLRALRLRRSGLHMAAGGGGWHLQQSPPGDNSINSSVNSSVHSSEDSEGALVTEEEDVSCDPNTDQTHYIMEITVGRQSSLKMMPEDWCGFWFLEFCID